MPILDNRGVLRASGIEILVNASAGAASLRARGQPQRNIAVGAGAQSVREASFPHTGFPLGECIHLATKAAILFRPENPVAQG
jgi:hypothetical protein